MFCLKNFHCLTHLLSEASLSFSASFVVKLLQFLKGKPQHVPVKNTSVFNCVFVFSASKFDNTSLDLSVESFIWPFHIDWSTNDYYFN